MENWYLKQPIPHLKSHIMENSYTSQKLALPKFTIASFLFLIFWCIAQTVTAQNYVLVFSDEFDGTSVDTSNWTFLIGDGTDQGLPAGWGNNELQYYREENTTVAGGLMTITAKEESFAGYNYTSSRLITENKQDFTYGRMEMRAKMPIGQGIWPAFWMFFTAPGKYGGWAASGEIDIMEYIGSEPDEVFGTIHFGQPFPGNVFSSIEYTLPSGTFNDDFHTFAIEWEPNEIRWYVDDILYATQNNWWSNGGPYPAPFDQPFHLLLNLAVGGNLPGNPDATTVFPQEYVIDYVRVYEDADLPTVSLAANNLNPGAAEDIILTATPSATQGVSKVEFYQGDFKLGESTSSPYMLTVPNAEAGSYAVRAIVTDNNGKVNYSDFLDITVGGGGQGPYAIIPASIPGMIEVENFDTGGQGEAYNDTDPTLNEGSKVSGNLYRSHEGSDLETTSDTGGGQNLGFIANGEWLEYTVNVAEAGLYDIIARVASQSNTGSFGLEFDGVDKTGPVSFPATGGAQTWVDIIKENVQLDVGVQVMRLNLLANAFNINKITISPADPASGEKVTFDDMEHGDPFNNGWFAFGGSVGGGGINPIDTDLPPLNGGAFSLDSGWGSGGTPGFYGGFGRTNLVDISQTTYFNMWINPFVGAQDYTLEINLQELDNGDGNQDEFQYDLVVSPTGPGAITEGGWQLISIPLTDFADDNSNITGGNGVLDAIIENVVIAVIGNSGSDANFRTDFWAFTNGPLGPEIEVDPDSFDFGQIGTNSSAARVFIVSNDGCTDLEVTGTSIGGTDAGDFGIVSGEAPFTVVPGGSQNILVSFAPSSLGAKTASLIIESTDADESSLEVMLNGEGVEGPDINKVIFDDMEHGDPLSNDYFSFGGLSSVTLAATSADLPPENSGAFAIETSMSSGGESGFFGGFGRTFPVDLSSMTHFNFWINPDAGQDYTIEIQLQDDDNGDDLIPFPSEGNDDEFQVNFAVNDSGDAISGGGWQLISIPLSDFFDDNSLQNGGNGVLDPIAVDMGGNGQLVNVIFGFISNSGADVSLRTDFWCFSEGPLGVTDPDIEVTPASGNFGLVSPGTSKSQTFVVANNGGAALDVSGVSLGGADAGEFSIESGNAPFTIAIGGNAEIEVSFNPGSLGAKTAVLSIESNDPDQGTVDVPLAGEGSGINKVIFDDMEHGDPLANGWFAFGGAVGGGGIDPNSAALPPTDAGAFSLQTGWGSGGTPGFYGGFGRENIVDIGGMTHFNFWINPSADQEYTLEINLQDDEDSDGNLDDEFQYNLEVSPSGPGAISGGGWQLISIPLSDFFDDNGFIPVGDGNGILDTRIVNVVVAVIGTGSDVNFQTDFWCFSEEEIKAKIVFDDMEHGDPFGNGWLTFGGAVGGGGIDPNTTDLPPANGGEFSLQTGWGSGGTPGFFGGFGRVNPTHIADVTHFNLWINPDAGQDYLLEINLQEDDNGDNAFPFPAPDDDEFQYNLEIKSEGTDVVSGGGWQLVSIPLTDFFDDNSIHGGNGVFDPVPVGSGGNGQLTGVIIAVTSNSGADVTFRTDFWCFSNGALVAPPTEPDPLSITDFVLVNADDNSDIMTLADGDMIDVSTLPTMNLNIRTEATMDAESVFMELSGAQSNTRTENVAPYALFGDNSGDYASHLFALGTYNLSATAYSGDNQGGMAGATSSIGFSFINPGGDAPLILVDSATDAPIMDLVEGTVINKSVLGDLLFGIIYNADLNPNGVKFDLSGPISESRREGSKPPYSLFGDFGVDIQGKMFPAGEYTLTANPKSGPTVTVNFEVVDTDPLCEDFEAILDATTNPSACGESDGTATVVVTNFASPLVFDWSHDMSLDGDTATGLAAGDYTVTVTDDNGCTETLMFSLTEPDLPEVTLDPFTDILDTDAPFALTGGMPAGGTYDGDGVGNGMFDPSIGAGTYEITYTFEDNQGCSNSASAFITVLSPQQMR